ncbi:60S ribosomal protein L39 [Lachnellula cervina]|uniref:Large ribosomal subunit protein eL39 n=1 Tax=Lachnellula cervina TaxID=1316786 RepID=A0A7D8YPY0_9HELO|nr:60S ribosomal protein L39 [Lachnellula cervina]
MPSHKSFRTKQKLARAQKQNRPIPQWIRLRTGNTIRYLYPSTNDPSHDLFSTATRAVEDIRHKDKKTCRLTLKTDTTRRGDIGVRLASVSERITPHTTSSLVLLRLRLTTNNINGWMDMLGFLK